MKTYDEIIKNHAVIDQAWHLKDYEAFKQAIMAAYSLGEVQGFSSGMDSVLASLRRVKVGLEQSWTPTGNGHEGPYPQK